jgi:hypothetical protein
VETRELAESGDDDDDRMIEAPVVHVVTGAFGYTGRYITAASWSREEA